MDVFSQMVQKIIQEQEGIIGPIALEQARKVPGLNYDQTKQEVTLNGDRTVIVEKLVEKYKDLFGQASVEVCRDAARGYMKDLPADKIPALLK